MSTVGSIVVNISANLETFEKGMEKAGKALKGFVGGIGVPLSIGAAAAAIKHLIDSSENTIAAQTKMAARLGFTTERMAGLEFGAKRLGMNTDELAGSFLFLQRTVGEAGVAGSEAQKKLAHLGIDPQKLKVGDFAGNIGMIADKVMAIADPAQRMAAWFEIVGRHGQALIPLLSKGSAGMAEMEARARAMGLTFSGAEGQKVLEKVKAWKAAWADLGAVVEGVGHKIAAATASAGVPTFLSNAARNIAAGFGAIPELTQNTINRFRDQEEVRKESVARAKEESDAKKAQIRDENIAQRNALQFEVKEYLEAEKKKREAIGLTAAEAKAADLMSRGADKKTVAPILQAGLAANAVKSAEALKEFTRNLQEQIDTFGKSAAEIAAYRLALQGVGEAGQDAARKLAAMHEGQRITQDAQGPLDLLAKKQRELQQLLQLGAISWDVYKLSVGKAAQEIVAASGAMADVRSNAAIQRGSSAESSLFAKNRIEALTGGRANDPAAMLKDALAIQARKQDEQIALAGRMVKALEDGGFTVVTK